MDMDRVLMLLPVSGFYLAYLIKMLLLRRQGIRGNLLGKGSKPRRVIFVERLIQSITYTGAAIQYATILVPGFGWPLWGGLRLWFLGFALAALADLFFVLAVVKMQSNWRAGFVRDQKTTLVTGGVYSISRNPAFTGFDLLYLGCLLAYPTLLTFLWCIAAVLVFHFQILAEEGYLLSEFDRDYVAYQNKVCRYIGKKQ